MLFLPFAEGNPTLQIALSVIICLLPWYLSETRVPPTSENSVDTVSTVIVQRYCNFSVFRARSTRPIQVQYYILYQTSMSMLQGPANGQDGIDTAFAVLLCLD